MYELKASVISFFFPFFFSVFNVKLQIKEKYIFIQSNIYLKPAVTIRRKF